MILREITNIIESVAPLSYQEQWDNSGLQVGDPSAEIHAALLTTDITEAVVSEAIAKKCNLIISHHPLLFHGLKTLCGYTPQERCAMLAIEHHIAIYSCHTPIDAYLHGVSGRMLEILGVKQYQILQPKLPNLNYGLGAIGDLDQPVDFLSFLPIIKQRFEARFLQYTLPTQPTIQRIAVCGGAGIELAEQAILQGANLFITADAKYHDILDLNERIALVNLDHWTTEHFTRNIFQELLQETIPTYISQADQTPLYCI